LGSQVSSVHTVAIFFVIFQKIHFSVRSKNKNKIIFNYYCDSSFDFLVFSKHVGLISSNQVLILQRYIHKRLHQRGQVFFKLDCHLATTHKGLESRMGKGQGKFFNYRCLFYPGKLLFLFKGVSRNFFKCIVSGLKKQLCIQTIVDFF
jgi:ribosomal protein L16/L10AE